MSRARTISGVAVLIGIIAFLGLLTTGIGVYELRKALRARVAAESADRKFEADQERLRGMLRSADAAEKTVAELKEKAAAAAASVPAPAAGTATNVSATRAARTGSREDWERLEAQFPEVREMLAEVHRSQIGRSYGLFFAQAGLTPAQIEKFVGATVDLYDQNEVMSPTGFYPTANQLPEDQLRAILGDQAFQQLQNYGRMMPANFLAVSVAASAGSAGAPLSSEQEVQLAQIVASNSPAYQSGQRLTLNAVDWDSAEAQAQSLLSPSQWKTAEGIFLNYQYQLSLIQARQSQGSATAAKAGGK